MATADCVDSDGKQFSRTRSESKQLEPWKRHIIQQLKHRDQAQKIRFQDLICSYLNLLEHCTRNTLIAKGLFSFPRLHSSLKDVSSLKTSTGELAYQVVELQQKIKIKNAFLDEQQIKLCETENDLSTAQLKHDLLLADVEELTETNRILKSEYDSLNECYQHTDRGYREERLHGSDLEEDLVRMKQQAAARMNSRNERRHRARQAGIQKKLEKAASKKSNTEDASLSPLPLSPRSKSGERLEKTEENHPRVRSASATSPRLFDSIRVLFEKKMRGNSVSSVEDYHTPLKICLFARVPAKPLQCLDAHELGINAVRFSPSSNLVATGGTAIKLWEVQSGMLHHRLTLDGSNEGISSIEFDSTGGQILAGSLDKSALFWRLDNCVPKFALTGHSRKVTAARFKCNLPQVVTGSADRTIKIWDLQRAACIQTIEVSSYCSDLVCLGHLIISGHFDRKIRFWDNRTVSCTQEVPLQGKVTSIDISPDHRDLLVCSREESLQVVDLRMNNIKKTFRADGFKCGSDSTKAIFSPDGSYLAAGSADGAVYIWNIKNGNLETRLSDMHRSSVNAVAWSMSGEYVVSVDKSRCAILWSDI